MSTLCDVRVPMVFSLVFFIIIFNCFTVKPSKLLWMGVVCVMNEMFDYMENYSTRSKGAYLKLHISLQEYATLLINKNEFEFITKMSLKCNKFARLVKPILWMVVVRFKYNKHNLPTQSGRTDRHPTIQLSCLWINDKGTTRWRIAVCMSLLHLYR